MSNCKIHNNSNLQIDNEIHSLVDFVKNRFKFNRPPSIFLQDDPDNAQNTLAKTGYYDPDKFEIHIYTTGRHPKDILRSIAHELVHHFQNEKGQLTNVGYSGKGYAQKNPHLRSMELQANDPMLFRDWEDSLKENNPTIYNEWRNKNMSTKQWKNKELNKLLLEKFNLKEEINEENQMKKEYDLEENKDRIFAPNHYCAHHVIHEGKEGFTVDHNWNEKLGKVTQYDVKFLDGSVKRNIHESKLTILEAFTAEAHGKMTEHPPTKKDEEEEQLDEASQLIWRQMAKANQNTAKKFLDKGKISQDEYDRMWGDKENLNEEEENKKPDEDGDGVPDWADKKPGKDDHENKEDKKESTKEWKNRQMSENLNKKWGFTMNLDKLKK